LSASRPPDRQPTKHTQHGMAAVTELCLALAVAEFDEALTFYG
jgi:hypothetical protein